MVDIGIDRESTTRTWDADIVECIKCISIVKSREKQRRKRFRSKVTSRNQRLFRTRRQWIEAKTEELREDQMARVGERLQRTTERLRWMYKRVATWERDQKVTRITARHGKPFPRNLTIADRFASEWAPILSRSHYTVLLADLPAQLAIFAIIPKQQTVTEHDNSTLMTDITEAEVLEAITQLSRHKAAGQDGLNNDFYKDTAALMVPALVTISNQILSGASMPASFLEALIIPLRKKGDSDDAMDYRPISLLQTSYKIVVQVIARRLQRILPRVISSSQQGFVHGRQMQKTVMMMMAQLTTATSEEDLAAAYSRCILLLDFRKAYDTVDREFLYAALHHFGFSEEFIELIQQMHTGTRASFLVNGEISEAIPVTSGIRQGCPLAPLLFLIVVEILGLALKQDPALQGLPVPGRESEEHIFSAFVDDSTVFLNQASQIPRTLEVVRGFGQMSGLHVQPSKSKIIFLNTAITQSHFEEIDVVAADETTRYLGYEVGTGRMVNRNWALRIRRIQRRLLTATRVATSVENRILILNSIVLPSILFTAAVFDLPKWAEVEIHNLYKQFIWAHSTSKERSRHKVNPGLLVTPRKAGGIGIVAVTVAIKTQRTKHALLWLTQRSDEYSAAWLTWIFREAKEMRTRRISPAPVLSRTNTKWAPGQKLRQELREWIAPSSPQLQLVHDRVHHYYEDLIQSAASWREDGEWILSYNAPFPRRETTSTEFPASISSFWATFSWSDNPWIRDHRGTMLKGRKFNRIPDGMIGDLFIRRTGPAEFVMVLPEKTLELPGHTEAKLRRWATVLLLASPEIPVGGVIDDNPTLRLRQPPKELANYRWTIRTDGRIEGKTRNWGEGIRKQVILEQAANGIRWTGIDQGSGTGEDWSRSIGDLVFEAHPRIHHFPWSAPATIVNRRLVTLIGKQAFQRNKKELGRSLRNVINRLEGVMLKDQWQHAALGQTPQQVWEHSDGLTEYQVWTGYRVALRKLNLHHAGRKKDKTCKMSPQCSGADETIEHLFWECPRAQAVWDKLVSQWTGEHASRQRTQQYLSACASRQVLSIPKHRKSLLLSRFQDDVEEAEKVWKRMWHILSTICQTLLWKNRVDAVFRHESHPVEVGTRTFWTASLRQLRAIAKKEHRTTDTVLRGAMLSACILMLESEPQGVPIFSGPDHEQPPGTPALISWLRKFQRSCT